MDNRIEQTYTLRPATAADREFLERVYLESRAEEFAQTGWSAEQIGAFLKMQFDIQTRAYQFQHPTADNSIIEDAHGAAIGRLIVNRADDEIRLVDIAILTACRNRRVGTLVLEDLQREAAAAGKIVSLSVLNANPAARRFYERHGFEITGADELYSAMKWTPPDDGGEERESNA